LVTGEDRQKLAETAGQAVSFLRSYATRKDLPEIAARETTALADRVAVALAVLAQPCQECGRLEAEVERWERQQIRPQEIIDRLLAAERQLEQTRAALRPLITTCREYVGSDRCNAPAEFLLWGKLIPTEALGPRCYDHAAKHIGHRALGDPAWAVLDLRPARAALAATEQS
jgi:hypothetical protein